MADKEATVYIVDVGATMARCRGGRAETDFDWAMRYVWDKIGTTVAASRKTWTVGVLGLRTDGTANAQQAEDGYENITVFQDITSMALTSLRALHDRVRPSKTETGDAVSAIILAVDMIAKAAPKRLKYQRKIVLVTDGLGPIDGDDFDDVAYQLNDLGIQLVVVGVDFDDVDYGYKEEDKPPLKQHNERLLRLLVEKCDNGVFGTIAEAIAELARPNIKATRPYKTYDGLLTLGNPETDDAALDINVERYFLTKLARPPPATTVVVKAGANPDSMQSSQTLDFDTPTDLSKVQTTRVYTVPDPAAPGGKREVDFDRLDKGYEYGRTAVHISDSDRNITQLQTAKGFDIVGFVSQDNYQPFLNMGESCIILPRRCSEKNELAFSSLVHAMADTKTCAVARLVAKEMKDPQLLLLLPTVSDGLVCFYDVPLPFAEDIRTFPFPPLDKVVTASGAVVTKHRLLPNDKLNEAMSRYVDSMDISMFGTDDDGQPAEYAGLSDNYSPILYRVNKALNFRAVHPTEPYVQQDNDFIMRFSHPPAGLARQVLPQIESLIRVADVKKVPPKAKGKAGRHVDTPMSGLDIDALLATPAPAAAKKGSVKKTPPISRDNAIPEFKQALARSVDVDEIARLTDEMGSIVRGLISSSTDDLHYERAAENMRVMRQELISLEEPALYNKFVTDLKASLASGKLGGPHLEMRYQLRMSGLGLITRTEADESDVTDEAAREFVRHFKA